MISAIGKQIIWMRVQRYLAWHTPRLIATRGPGAVMAAKAVQLAYEPEQKVRLVIPPIKTKESDSAIAIAKGILGLTPHDRATTWTKVLNFSLAREIAIRDPQVIVVALPAPAIEKELQTQLRFQEIINTHKEAVESKIQVRHVRPLKPKGYAAELTYQRRTYEAHWSQLLSVRHVMAIVAVLGNFSKDEQSLEKNMKKLRRIEPVSGDLSFEAGINGSELLSYTLYPTWEGMLEALEVLADAPASGRKVALLKADSTMGMPDQYTSQAVAEAVGEAAALGIFVGSAMKQVQAVVKQAAPNLDTHYFETTKEAYRWLTPYLRSGDLLLAVGSVAE